MVGAPDETWVEAVTAFVTLTPGAEATEADLIAHVRDQIAAHKAPKSVRFIEAIPKSAVGKILRRSCANRCGQTAETGTGGMDMNDIRVERDGDVTVVVMARPDRHNAVDGGMARELADAFREFEESDAKVAVLAGDGPSFCAGADLKAVRTERSNALTLGATGRWGRPGWTSTSR